MAAHDASSRRAEQRGAAFVPAFAEWNRAKLYGAAVVAALLAALFARPAMEMANTWSLEGSYYTHGFLIPPLSAYLLWSERERLAGLRPRPDARGYVLVCAGALMLWGGAFLGFRVFEQAALLPMLFGVGVVLFGREIVNASWFPLAFLSFMIPIPPSMTQAVAFRIKILATEGAVFVANVIGLPMLRQGSYIHFGDDRLLIGEVCGGLRSLIALLALGALLAYWSRSRNWARWALFASSAPIAVGANISRIFFLCLVGYFWGSERAGGLVHDVSGVLIFVVALALFLGLESLLRRAAPGESGARS